jgi:predicted deacylase
MLTLRLVAPSLLFALVALSPSTRADATAAFESRTEFVSALPERHESLNILDTEIEPGSLSRLVLSVSESFAGSHVETSVVVMRGKQSGPVLCIIAGVHGDEVNGVEVVRRTLSALTPASLRGTLIAVPIANPSAFRRGSRYLPDRRDLNRYFPGRSRGSSASRIAHGLFENVIRKCGAVVDLHTGSFQRSNLHQLRADLSGRDTAELSAAFGAAVIVNNAGRTGTLRRAATDQGIPAITVEAGESARFDENHVLEALDGIMRLLRTRGMIVETEFVAIPEPPRRLVAPDPPPLGPLFDLDDPSAIDPTAYLKTRWIRCDQGGILVSQIRLGEEVRAGQVLGTISDPLSDEVEGIASPLSGRVIGMALDQVVMPGFAAYHIAFDARPLREMSSTAAEASAEMGSEDSLEGLDLEERPE